MVTHQSYRVIENLLCEQPVGSSGTPNDVSCKSGPNRQLLENLRKQIGQPPVGEAKLLSTLGPTSTLWKKQLLRYTRLP